MSEDARDVALAELRSRNAKQQFLATLDTVKTRLSPATIAQDAMGSAKDKARSMVRRHPLAIATAAGAIGLLLSRRLIGRRLARRKIEHATDDTSSR
ncbi:hypothetical protein [Sphingosinithalassobacter portus]|uniref:hypothetical protein n=1 Tax=Stakelama portus TaxID=2676234 RepID=UPI000D6DD579|nr:hypothetical protein [Sphingosinithalassobacter portus]